MADVGVINGSSRYLNGQIVTDLVRFGFDAKFYDYHMIPK